MAAANPPSGVPRSLAMPALSLPPWMAEPVRFVIAVLAALTVFGAVVMIQGENPLIAYQDMFNSTLRSKYGFSEVLVRMIPLLLCALAVALPARIGLVNVGGEGQLYLGAWGASWVALTFTGVPMAVMLPAMFVAAAVMGGAWALIPAVLRAKGWLNETISTLLLNYVAILFVQYFVYGAWKDPTSANFPQSERFAPAAIIPNFGDYRVHWGIFIGLAAVGVMFMVMKYTRWGYEMRAVGGNTEASRRSGIPIALYIVLTLVVGGALAGLAGFGEVSAIQGRLRPSVSPGYGYIGFLASWMANHNPLTIIPMTFVLAMLTAGGDSLQINQGLPFASVNLLMAMTLFAVLALRAKPKGERF